MQPINFIDPVPAVKQRSIAFWYIVSCVSFVAIVTMIAAIQTMQVSYLHKLEKSTLHSRANNDILHKS